MLNFLRTPEFYISLILCSTFIKFILDIYGVSIGLNFGVCLIALLLIVAIFSKSIKDFDISYQTLIICSLLFFIFLFQMLIFLASYGLKNVFSTKFYILVFTFIFIFIVLYTKPKSYLIINYIVLTSSFCSVLFIYTYPKIFYGGVLANDEFVSLYMHAGTLSGLGIICGYVFLSRGGEFTFSLIKPIHVYVLTLISLVALLMSGSRGPLISVIFLIMFDIILIKGVLKQNLKNMMILIVTVCFCFVVLPSSSGQIEILINRTFARLSELFNDGNNARSDMLIYSFSSIDIKTILFGHGFSSFGLNYNQADIFGYPHNFIAELYYEGGIFSLTTLLVILLYSVYLCFRYKSYLYLPLFYSTFLSLKSSTLVGNRLFFLFLFMSIILVARQNKKNLER